MSTLRVTVAVITFNRSGFLRETLAGLVRQDYPAGCWELLVIDNNSTDDTRDVVASFLAATPSPRWIPEVRPGLDHGRNRAIDEARGDVIADLEAVIRDRREHPQPGSYTNELLEDEERRLKKVGEEATEFVVAAARGDRAAALRESADLVYHLLVVCASLGIPWTEVEATLAGRRGAARRRTAERPARAPTPPSGGRATRRAPRTRR